MSYSKQLRFRIGFGSLAPPLDGSADIYCGVEMAYFSNIRPVLLILMLACGNVLSAAVSTEADAADRSSSKNKDLAVIKGKVLDAAGSPIADATVAIFRVGTTKLLKQVRSTANGSFVAKILPGKYSVLAVAEGFNPATVSSVEVGRSAQIDYGFKLEKAGSGNTLPEKRIDRNNPKWVIRAAQISRSIYQNAEGSAPLDTTAELDNEVLAKEERGSSKEPQTVVETYFADTRSGSYNGINAATMIPLSESAEVVVAGQTGIGKNAPQRIEAQLQFRPSDKHQIRVSSSFANLGDIETLHGGRDISQFTVQGSDEWKVREGLILVFGMDYSRFIGDSDDFSVSPRLGFLYDIDSKTRFTSSYTSFTEERTWSRAIEFENAQVLFREPAAIEDIATKDGKPLMQKSSRMAFGIERLLDDRSSVELKLFFDTVTGRGVGLTNIPIDSLDPNGFQQFTVGQQGGAQGIGLVYSRRLSGRFTATAGYSFGRGQKLSDDGISDPSQLFENDLFQSVFGQLEADLRSGTNVRTIFRLSPQATVFAIDPFHGRLAIYDPSLSVLITQNLPTLGLPIHAEAIFDARNIFGFNTSVTGEQSVLRLNSQDRSLRGGILFRF